MNVKTWLDFLKKSKQNNKFSSPHDPAREIRINLAPGNFLGAPTTLPTLLTEKNQLNEDLHDALSDAGLRGIHSVDFSIYGSAVSITIIPEEITVDLNQHKLKTVLMSHLTSKGYIQESRALTEEKGRMRQYGIYRFGCLIEYDTTAGDRQRGLDDIVSDIRAIPTVTIVSVVLGNERISSGRYVAGLQIKFIPSFPGNLSQPEEAKAYVLRMIKRIKNVRTVSRVTLKTDRVE